MEFFIVVKQLRIMYGFYLLYKNTSFLEMFLRGYLRSAKDPEASGIFTSFCHALNKHPKVTCRKLMAEQLLELAGSDEAAFDLFFVMFEEHLKANYPGLTIDDEPGRPPNPGTVICCDGNPGEFITLIKQLRTAYEPILVYKKATFLERFFMGYCRCPREHLAGGIFSHFLHSLSNHPKLTYRNSMAEQLIELAGSDEAAFDLFFVMFEEHLKAHYPAFSIQDGEPATTEEEKNR